MITKLLLKDAAERAVFTAIEVLLGFITVVGFMPLSADWILIGSTVVTATVISFLKSILVARREDTISPASVLKE